VTPERRNGVAGTTEVDVRESVCGRLGESRRTEILLETELAARVKPTRGTGADRPPAASLPPHQPQAHMARS
jgi:hypothetical protein